MSAEIAGATPGIKSIASRVAYLACEVRIEEGASPTDVWCGEINGATHSAEILLVALGKMGIEVDADLLLESAGRVVDDTLPGGRIRAEAIHAQELIQAARERRQEQGEL